MDFDQVAEEVTEELVTRDDPDLEAIDDSTISAVVEETLPVLVEEYGWEPVGRHGGGDVEESGLHGG